MVFNYSQPTINFVTPGTIGSADIVVDDSLVYQTVYGFGASLSKRCTRFSAEYLIKLTQADSSAGLLNNLKASCRIPILVRLLTVFNRYRTLKATGSSWIIYLMVRCSAPH